MNQIHQIAAKIFSTLKGIPYLPKKAVLVIDMLLAAVSFTITYWLCFRLVRADISLHIFIIKLLTCLVITVFFFVLFKTHLNLLRYSTFKDALRVFIAVSCANMTMLVINKLLSIFYERSIFPGEGLFVNCILTFCFVFFFRMSVRLLFDFMRIARRKVDINLPSSLLIYGVGSTSISMAKMINSNDHLPYTIAGFLAPDKNAHRKEIIGFPVFYRDDFFNNIAKYKDIKAILIIPKEMERSEKQFFADMCSEHKIDLLSAPQIEDWKDFGKNIRKIKKIKIEDLLGRIPIQIDIESIGKNLKDKNILITGAAGSIGSEIIRQISQFDLNLLIICDIAESPLHQLGLELSDKFPNITSVSVIADVKNYNQMERVFEKYKPQYVYHAAAYKHVPLMEEHPCEAVLTNVLGSKNVIDLAMRYNAEAFVMISTDKAVNPSNVMGATKRIAEIYVQSLYRKIKNQSPETAMRIITTRFGNVLGSNGSVIPRFNSQIKAGGPVTVTHSEIIRFFMTIPEACRLVLEAGNFGKGGEVFVFDMGDPVKIKDLAEKMIRLSGLEPYKDIEIKFTGLRPGEKLHEELLYDKEKVIPTNNKKIKIGIVQEYDYEKVVSILASLIETATQFDKIETVKLMKLLAPEFVSQNSIYAELDKQN